MNLMNSLKEIPCDAESREGKELADIKELSPDLINTSWCMVRTRSD